MQLKRFLKRCIFVWKYTGLSEIKGIRVVLEVFEAFQRTSQIGVIFYKLSCIVDPNIKSET